MATPVEQLEAMRSLRENWDGYQGLAPSNDVIDVATEFVHLLEAIRGRDPNASEVFVCPGRNGGVLVEWDDASSECEMEINADGSFGFVTENKLTGEMTEKPFRPGQFAPAELLRMLVELVPA